MFKPTIPRTVAALVAAIPLLANAAWRDAQGKPLPDTPSMKSSGDFGVQLVLTPDEKAFRDAWNAASKEPPRLVTTNKTTQGKTIGGMLIFGGCTPNAEKRCDVSADFALERPGNITLPAGKGPVWTAAPMEPGIFQLGLVNMTMGFDKNDTPGTYHLHATVTDNVAKKTLKLVTTFEVTK